MIVIDNFLALGPVVVQAVQLFFVAGVPVIKYLLLGGNAAQGYFARWLCLRLKQQGLANGANGQGQHQTKSIKNFFIGEIAV